MLPTTTLYLCLVAIFTSPAMASSSSAVTNHNNPLSNIQCHCLTFYTYSSPAACAYPHSQNISWSAAQTLASSHNLDITFASPTTISRVLEADQPLPTRVLMSMYGGGGRARQAHEVGSRIVCGSKEEIERKYLGGNGRVKQAISVEARRCDGLASEIVGIFLLMLALYAVGDYLWSRFLTKNGPIQLSGGEKDLFAHAEDGLLTQSFTSPQLNEEIEVRLDSTATPSTYQIAAS